MRTAILDGRLAEADLSARCVAKFLGLTTSVFYHHYGSFELFLYRVSIAGLSLVADEMEAAVRSTRSPLLRIAEYYLELALSRPVLFDLMMQRPFPWAEIRAKQLLDTNEGLRGWNVLVTAMRDAGSDNPLEDARLFHATIHGLAALTRNGRMNIDDLDHTDREVALRTARRLVRMFQRALRVRRAYAYSRATSRAARRPRGGTAR
ncbi:MAG TPA: WHG domain-containing protein [Kofleriaceae bacterium]|nr:WHG domain-containing protein [Kofleriaceae bacterium]